MKLESVSINAVSSAFPRPVTLSLHQLPDGLIAVVGPNGHGKTFLLESALAATYRVLPSREHALVDYALGRESSIAAHWLFDGRRGRCSPRRRCTRALNSPRN